jgi:glycine betaine/proline transport system substrate-binding protein
VAKGRMRGLRAFLCLCLLGLASLSAMAQQTPCNAGNPVKLADQSWESATFTMHVVKAVLETAYGCKTEVVPGTPAATESALAQNDLQIIAEIWTGRSPIIEKAAKAGDVRIVGDTLQGGAQQGWYVPDYVVHGDSARGIEAVAPDLKSWRDLPRYKQLFRDPEDPSKGRFLNCPSGWVCEQTNSRLLEIHDLNDDYTNFRAGTGAALDSAISAAYDRGVPILFYYWQPAGLMAKYKFAKVEQDVFNQECWDKIVSGQGTLCSSDFLTAKLGIGVSTPFAQANPEIVAFLERLSFQAPLLNKMVLDMTESRAEGRDIAARFLRANPDIWHAWLPADAAARADTALNLTQPTVAGRGIFPDWSVAEFVNQRLVAIVKHYGESLRKVSEVILTKILLPVERLMQAIPAWLFLAFVAVLSWHGTRKTLPTILYVICLYAIGAVGLWDKLMQTFSLVLVSTVFSIIVGIPIGVLAAGSKVLRRVLTPVLDVMQTLPSFVYLIPVLMLFGLGKVPALFATIIYAIPPLIRLTILGLHQVDRNVMEAAQSFGVTRWQMLLRVTLPLARPSIMAGINQTTMMALAMVVVASMIGARGLGEDVLAGIQTLDVGRGLQAGVAIVILAIIIDRITQAYGRPRRRRQAMRQQEGAR